MNKTGQVFTAQHNRSPVFLKAGLVKNSKDYKWSSYNYYLSDKETITDKDFLKKYFANIRGFIEFNNQSNSDKCLDFNEKERYTDDDLKVIISGM